MPKDYTKGTNNEGTAPFNMALTTLMEINEILKQITKVSILFEEGYTAGQIQHTKYRLVKALYVRSTPLLKKEQKELLKPMIDQLKPLSIPEVNRRGKVMKQVEGYDPKFDEVLDNMIILIQEKLQDEGYFMPPKSDPRFSWTYD